MEAIFELFVAAVSAVVELLVSFAFLLAELLFFAVEFLVLLLTAGPARAREKAAERRLARSQRKTEKLVPTTANESADRPREDPVTATAFGDHGSNPPTRNSPTLQRRPQRVVVFVLAVIAVAVGMFAVKSYLEHLKKQRISITEAQISELAKKFLADIRDNGADGPRTGRLANTDAWGTPLELFVDRTAMGTLIVVRSAGPDEETATLDDMLAIETLGPIEQQIEPLKQRFRNLKADLKQAFEPEQPDAD